MQAAQETRGKVLIVDDDPLTRESLGELLEAVGYHVSSAANGMDALHYLRNRDHQPPDVILCDLGMPMMNGWVFRSQQQQDPELSKIPVVLLSGIHDARSAAGYLGTEDHLEKPIDVERLWGVLRRYCDSERSLS